MKPGSERIGKKGVSNRPVARVCVSTSARPTHVEGDTAVVVGGHGAHGRCDQVKRVDERSKGQPEDTKGEEDDEGERVANDEFEDASDGHAQTACVCG